GAARRGAPLGAAPGGPPGMRSRRRRRPPHRGAPGFLDRRARRAPAAALCPAARALLRRGNRRAHRLMLKTTPFHQRTAALCVSHAWRRWAGYLAASSYELTHEREYHAIRVAAALFDGSPLYKYMIRGRDAARLLDLVVTRNVMKASVGQVLYTPWCDHAGKVMDDGTIARLDDQLFRMTSAEPRLRWLAGTAR